MKIKTTIISLLIAAVGSIAFITALFLFSEDIMQHSNTFIRRFPRASITKTAQADLKYDSYYLAGADSKKVYLGSLTAPLVITEFDTNLKNKKTYTIGLDRDDFPFLSARVKVAPPYFYVTDGTVPVIYKGNISDWKATVAMHGTQRFIAAEPIDNSIMVFRAQDSKSGENVLGLLRLDGNRKITYAPTLLQKQIDGIFDTDGMLHYSTGTHKMVYLYHYRNQFIVADKNLKLGYRGNTIDTTKNAQLKVVTIKNSGIRKLAAPPYTVNTKSTVSNNLLFVNSGLRGRYEEPKMWQQASVVDVYDISRNAYLSSFYIYNIDKDKMSGFLAAGKSLYVINTKFLQRYALGKNLIGNPLNNTKQ